MKAVGRLNIAFIELMESLKGIGSSARGVYLIGSFAELMDKRDGRWHEGGRDFYMVTDEGDCHEIRAVDNPEEVLVPEAAWTDCRFKVGAPHRRENGRAYYSAEIVNESTGQTIGGEVSFKELW